MRFLFRMKDGSTQGRIFLYRDAISTWPDLSSRSSVRVITGIINYTCSPRLPFLLPRRPLPPPPSHSLPRPRLFHTCHLSSGLHPQPKPEPQPLRFDGILESMEKYYRIRYSVGAFTPLRKKILIQTNGDRKRTY